MNFYFADWPRATSVVGRFVPCWFYVPGRRACRAAGLADGERSVGAGAFLAGSPQAPSGVRCRTDGDPPAVLPSGGNGTAHCALTGTSAAESPP